MRHTQQVTSVTSLPPSPDDERKTRMRRYAIAMGIRTLCVVACFFVPGWWVLIPITAAVVLPYLAVVAANVGTSTAPAIVERPGGIVPVSGERR